MKSVLPVLLMTSLLALPSWADEHGESSGHCHKGKRYEEALSTLPKERADLVRGTMEKAKEAQVLKREAAKKLHAELLVISKADIFDRDAFLAKRGEIRALRNEMGAAWDATLADLSAQLTVEERRTLATAAEWKHRKHDGDHAKPEAK